MNISKINSFRIVVAALCLVLAVLVATPKVYAQDDDGYGGCDCDTGYADTSYSDSYAPDTGYADTSYQDSYTPDTAYGDTSYQDSYTPDTGYGDTSYSDSYTPDTGYGDTSYDDSYTPDTGYGDTSYQDSYTPSYSYTAPDTYSSGAGYESTPTFSVTNPIYSTPGVGYSSNIYTTPGTGYVAPTPVTHTTTPAPIVYNTPVQTQAQAQTQTAATSQPIIINNTNTNTNTLTNTNTAPVAQVVSTPPQQIVDYVYPRTTPIYQAPVANAPYVSLTQIPYTGFDFGPVGDAIYWAALLAFALAAAYLLVYYRGGAFALAGALISHRSSVTPVQFTEAEAESTPAVEAPIVEAPVAVNARLASIASPIQNLPTAEVRRMTSDAMIVSHSHNGSAPRIVITRA